jgi:hypothetical protein
MGLKGLISGFLLFAIHLVKGTKFIDDAADFADYMHVPGDGHRICDASG